MRVGTRVIGAEKALAKVSGVGGRLFSSFVPVLERWLVLTTNFIKRGELSGQVLNVRTGNLRSGIISSGVGVSGGRLTADIQAGTNASIVYARIHELGGTIVPKRANFLRFKTADGSWHMIKQVTIPARPYMRPAAEIMQPRLVEMLEKRITEYASGE